MTKWRYRTASIDGQTLTLYNWFGRKVGTVPCDDFYPPHEVLRDLEARQGSKIELVG